MTPAARPTTLAAMPLSPRSRASILAFVLAPLAALAACTADDPQIDSGRDQGGPSDAAAAADGGSTPDVGAPPGDDGGTETGGPRCNPSSPFGTPTQLGYAGGGFEEDRITLSADERDAVVSAISGTTVEWHYFTRTSTTQDFDTRDDSFVSGVDPVPQRWPTLTGDGLRMYHVRPAGNMQLVTSVRGDRSLAFGSAENVTVNGAPLVGQKPIISRDGMRLYYFDDATQTFFMAPRGNTPTLFLSALTVYSGIVTAALSADEKTLYAANASEVFSVTRSDVSSPFTNPVKLPPAISSLSQPRLSWVSDDDCVLYVLAVVGGTYETFVSRRGP